MVLFPSKTLLTRPAPALKVGPVLGLDEVTEILRLLVDVVAVVALDVRVDDGDHLATLRRHVGDHLGGMGELVRIPREVSGGANISIWVYNGFFQFGLQLSNIQSLYILCLSIAQ